MALCGKGRVDCVKKRRRGGQRWGDDVENCIGTKSSVAASKRTHSERTPGGTALVIEKSHGLVWPQSDHRPPHHPSSTTFMSSSQLPLKMVPMHLLVSAYTFRTSSFFSPNKATFTPFAPCSSLWLKPVLIIMYVQPIVSSSTCRTLTLRAALPHGNSHEDIYSMVR